MYIDSPQEQPVATAGITAWHLERSVLKAKAKPLVHQKEKRKKEKTMPFGINFMRSQVLYRAAQALVHYLLTSQGQKG